MNALDDIIAVDLVHTLQDTESHHFRRVGNRLDFSDHDIDRLHLPLVGEVEKGRINNVPVLGHEGGVVEVGNLRSQRKSCPYLKLPLHHIGSERRVLQLAAGGADVVHLDEHGIHRLGAISNLVSILSVIAQRITEFASGGLRKAIFSRADDSECHYEVMRVYRASYKQ